MAPEEGNVRPPPSWTPAGDAQKIPMPFYTGGPPPESIPLLPTPPPPKEHESSSSYFDAKQSQTASVQQSGNKTVTQKKVTVETKSKKYVSSSVLKKSSSSQVTVSEVPADNKVAAIPSLSKISPPKFVPITEPLPSSEPNSNKGSPAPVKAPVFGAPQEKSAVKPTTAKVKPKANIPGVKSVRAPAAIQKPKQSFGFKPVKPIFTPSEPVTSTEKPKVEPSPPVVAKIEPVIPVTKLEPVGPIDISSLPFATPPASVSSTPTLTDTPAAPPKDTVPKPEISRTPQKPGPAPAPAAPVVAPAPAPAPAPFTPSPIQSFIQPPKPVATPAPAPAPAPVPAFKPAPAPAPAPAFKLAPAPAFTPAPAPAPSVGGLSMPKPTPIPNTIPKPNPGTGGKGFSSQRTAPKRGRGVMTPAHASRIPICACCNMQIR